MQTTVSHLAYVREQLRVTINEIKATSEFESLVHLSNEFYSQAKVYWLSIYYVLIRSENTRLIYIYVGAGIHLRFTLDEALDFIQKQLEYYHSTKNPR
jgi:prefoldin subunit 5